ncbi:MAG: hypothetical protein A3H32_09380 [Betaproteobacteria bacterium RIFCSPLOWO2_02_FULL_63_19]|nr:MAG: hypothetical protein A3H32_09380 [Betaproteobacteria bacterium RIFCSPLOWO2_02_FULL_63_19]
MKRCGIPSPPGTSAADGLPCKSDLIAFRPGALGPIRVRPLASPHAAGEFRGARIAAPRFAAALAQASRAEQTLHRLPEGV